MSAALNDVPIYYAHDIDRIARPGGPHLPEGWAPPSEEGYLWGLWLEWAEGPGEAPGHRGAGLLGVGGQGL